MDNSVFTQQRVNSGGHTVSLFTGKVVLHIRRLRKYGLDSNVGHTPSVHPVRERGGTVSVPPKRWEAKRQDRADTIR